MLQCLRKSPFDGGSKLRWKLVAPKLTANDRSRRHQPLQARPLGQTSNITRRLQKNAVNMGTKFKGDCVKAIDFSTPYNWGYLRPRTRSRGYETEVRMKCGVHFQYISIYRV